VQKEVVLAGDTEKKRARELLSRFGTLKMKIIHILLLAAGGDSGGVVWLGLGAISGRPSNG